ncbi:MAG: metal ABC transporter permease [Bradymonadales bacterium]|nr:metal ABC transporter permease [Bradymonadales bacterium]
MSEALYFLGPALVMCLVIAAIHVYLGMHVLRREVIFVDLSLAQLAALGATVSTLFHVHHGSAVPYLFAFGFTAVGAVIFAFTRKSRKQVSQEAIIGIVYVVASAVTVLVLSRAPHGAEHMKDILVGTLLLTTWKQVGFVTVAYAVLGIANGLLARRFIEISWEPDEAEQKRRHVAWWDLLFYLLFGVVITISVQVAGILLVFSFLIVPAVTSRLFSVRIWPRLLIGWGIAILASILGLAASWLWDLPTGAAVVAAFGLLLAMAALARVWVPARG